MSELAAFFEDAAERLFGEVCDARLVEAAAEGVWPTDLWRALEDFSAPMILVAEDSGGMGAAPIEAAAILRAAGRHAAPGLLLETMVANRLLTQAGLEAAPGPVTLGFLSGQDGQDRPRAGDWRAWPQPALRWLGAASRVVLIIDAEAGLIAVIDAPSSGDAATADPSGEPLGRLLAADLARAEVRSLGGSYEAALSLACALRAAQMVGAMRWCLARTVEFTGERKQFGREIGKFQIIQQHMAQIAGEVAASGAIAEAALQAPQSERGAMMTAAARARLADAVDVVCALTHQVHGAMGFTAEYPLHLRTRRLMAWRDEFRSAALWRRQLAAPMVGCAANQAWPKLTALRG